MVVDCSVAEMEDEELVDVTRGLVLVDGCEDNVNIDIVEDVGAIKLTTLWPKLV